jgi:transcription elongation factor Elf1
MSARKFQKAVEHRDRSVTVFWAECSSCGHKKAINGQWIMVYRGNVLQLAVCGQCAAEFDLLMEQESKPGIGGEGVGVH